MASRRCGIPASARSVWVYGAAESSGLRQRAFLGCTYHPKGNETIERTN